MWWKARHLACSVALGTGTQTKKHFKFKNNAKCLQVQHSMSNITSYIASMSHSVRLFGLEFCWHGEKQTLLLKPLTQLQHRQAIFFSAYTDRKESILEYLFDIPVAFPMAICLFCLLTLLNEYSFFRYFRQKGKRNKDSGDLQKDGG